MKWLPAVLLLNSIVRAQMSAPDPVHPQTYRSVSGEFQCLVDPTDLYGKGPADYRLTRSGKDLWKRRLGFTLYQAVVSDQGRVGGYAYTRGLQGDRDRGEFKVILINTNGAVLIEETMKRKDSGFLHDLPQPCALGMEFDVAKNQFGVRVRNSDINERNEQVWTYDLASAKPVGKSSRQAAKWDDIHGTEKFTAKFRIQDLPERKLTRIGSLTFKSDKAPADNFGQIVDFRFSGGRHIGLLTLNADHEYHFLLLAHNGNVEKRFNLDLPKKLTEVSSPKFAWIATNRWVFIASAHGENGKATAWWLNVETGARDPISSFDSPSVEHVASDGAGGFVVLAQLRHKYNSEEDLARFDPDGKVFWRKRQDGYRGRDDELLGVEDVIVTSDHNVAVLSNTRKAIQFFTLDGKFIRLLPLEKSWMREPNYPTDLRSDGDGLLVYDFNGKPPVVRMSADTRLQAQFAPTYSDGRVLTIGAIDVSPQGNVWASDAESLSRLSDKGVAEFTIGSTPTPDSLTEIAGVTMSENAEIFAVDKRTASVHVFSTNGARLRVGKSDREDFAEKLYWAKISVGPEGDVYLSETSGRSGFVHFDPQGARVGKRSFNIDSIREELLPRPDGSFLMLGYHDAFMLNSLGDIARKISRREDRKWLAYCRDGSVAPDGSFAIVSAQGFYSRVDWPVTIFTAGGDPIRTIVLPAACRQIAWTGSLLLTHTDNELIAISADGTALWRAIIGKSWKDAELFAVENGSQTWLIDRSRKAAVGFALD
jgi:hypothetical protein